MGKWKNIMAMCAVMVFTVSLTACAGKEENEDIYTMDLNDIVTESLDKEADKELQEMESQETEFSEDATIGENVDTESEESEQNVGERVSNDVDKTISEEEESVVSNETNIAPQQSTETPDVGQQTSQQAQNVSVPSVTIVGSIKSLGDSSFSISRADVNSNIMVSTDEAVNVVYSGSTEFEVCTSTDGGITANYVAGTSSDLQIGRLVNIVGVYEGSDFVAQKITIKIFG